MLKKYLVLHLCLYSQSGLGACGAGPTCEACRRLARFARNGSLRSLEKCLLFCKRGSLRSQKNLIRLQFSFLQSGFYGPNGLCHYRLNDLSSLNGLHGLNGLYAFYSLKEPLIYFAYQCSALKMSKIAIF